MGLFSETTLKVAIIYVALKSAARFSKHSAFGTSQILPATPALDTFPRAPRGRAGTAFAGRELPPSRGSAQKEPAGRRGGRLPPDN